MDARERYLASLGARYGISSTGAAAHTRAPQRARRRAPLRPDGLTRPRAHRATACLRPADALPPAGTSSRPGRGRPCYRPTARERCRLGIQMTSPGRRVGHSAKRSRSPAPDFLGQGAAGRRWNNGAGRPATVLSPRAHGRRTRGARLPPHRAPHPRGIRPVRKLPRPGTITPGAETGAAGAQRRPARAGAPGTSRNRATPAADIEAAVTSPWRRARAGGSCARR
jgi:hypothetical protein